ncbi:hypothetical protein JAAARDRAFT_201173 [Jaapia argillacea MUCL 33604]|uniref:Uncharacterized protein n=1 Tax=Jaapia argillacea MUCL 33604 TaxID=933084 RepID=A0A067P2U1_9AGAM|nr:hypothetical protein JAAARDRAFT_201173 [Jaapia argillacea MUCL 33604]
MLPFLMESRKKLCKCRSHCLTYNPVAKKYEGEGYQISKTLWRWHQEDDRLATTILTVEEQFASQVLADVPSLSQGQHILSDVEGNTMSTKIPSEPSDSQADQLYSIQQEVIKCSLYITPPHSLIFVNKPSLSGPYQHPSFEGLNQPNSGLHALQKQSRTNASFLQNEFHLCELLHTIEMLSPNLSTLKLENRICEELAAINLFKENEWACQ